MPTPVQRQGPPSTNFFALDDRLQGLQTQIFLYGIPGSGGPNGKRKLWNLYGPQGGIHGVELAPQISGLMHVPFTQLISEGPYQVGGVHERVDWGKREINFAVNVGVGQPDTIFRYRMVEERWWSSLSATEDAYLGVFTRTHGWRWLRVRLAATPPTLLQLDPQAFGNNFQAWDVPMVAVDPYWRKRIETSKWVNDGTGDGDDDPTIPQTPWDQLEELIEDILEGLIPGISNLVPGMHIGEGNIVVPNRGSETAWPKFLVSGPGRAWIEDGPGGRMVELPLLTPQDGWMMVDTDPTARTLTGSKDPVDPLFMRIVRNSQLLDFLLHDLTDSTLPVWRRFNGRFTTPWPAKTVCRIKVRHSNARGSITALMPQKFNLPYA